MFCTTIIPTVGRPTLARAVESVLDQDFTADTCEIIVVNDSGQPLPPEPWQQAKNIRIVNTQRHERSIARNTGAALARGDYLHFLDDDDWLAPGALAAIWTLARERPAGWLYGRSQLVNSSGQPLLQLHHRLTGNAFLPTLAGEWIPLQASWIASQAFFGVGGFHPLLAGPEDIDLLRRVALRFDLAEADALVACVEWRTPASTTDYEYHSQHSRRAREAILSHPLAFARMQRGATSPYWHGRIARAYFTSLLWNLRQRRPFTAGSRALLGLRAAAHARRQLLAADFWHSLARPYASDTFRRGLAAQPQEG